MLRRADDQYRRIIFNAQMYANTGAGTVQKAVDMATKDFLMRGIDCIEYKNGARHTISDYADMAIRTAERRAYLWGKGQKRKEWGLSLVIVNKRGDHPCPQCAKWVGKVLIDDVYSGGKPDGKHTLLSEAMEQGFLHPRCKDGFTTYFPGITTVPDPATEDDLREAEQAEDIEQRRQHAERMAEKWDRRAKYSLDPADKHASEARAEEWREAAEGSSIDQKRTENQDAQTKEENNWRRGIPDNVTDAYAKTSEPGAGQIVFEPGYKKDKRHSDEVRISQWIHDTYGGDIVLLSESANMREKRADYLWRGKLWDLKTPSSPKAADDRIRHGAKQIQENPGGIILDFKIMILVWPNS